MTNAIVLGGVRYNVAEAYETELVVRVWSSRARTAPGPRPPGLNVATSAEADRLTREWGFREFADEVLVVPATEDGFIEAVVARVAPEVLGWCHRRDNEPRLIVMPEGVADPRDDCYWGPSQCNARAFRALTFWGESRNHAVDWDWWGHTAVVVPGTYWGHQVEVGSGANWHHDPGFSTGPFQNSWGVDNWENAPPTRPLADLQQQMEALAEHGQPLEDYLEDLNRRVMETLRVEFGDSYEGDVPPEPAEQDPRAKPTNTEELREWLRGEGAEDRPQQFTSEGGYFSDN